MVSAHSKSPNWQIDLVTVTFYMVRMVMAWMTIYQKMPYIVRWRRTADDMERPDSNSNTKEAPLFQSQMNMVWCLLAMALAIVPRIFNIQPTSTNCYCDHPNLTAAGKKIKAN